MDLATNLKFNIFVFFAIYFFVSGVDGYIILPTAWYYIRSLGLSKVFYGAVLAAEPLGHLLFSPILCKLADKTRRVKFILFVCVLVKVISNLVYAIPVSGFCPLVGRFFSGAASGSYGVMYGEIVRYTVNENRAMLFILVNSMFSLGGSCGPAFGSILTFRVNILGWNINDGNSPGVVLAIAWFVLLCALIFLPSDFGTQEVCLTDKDEVDLLEGVSKPDTMIKSLNSTVWYLFYSAFVNSVVVATITGTMPLLAMELFHLKLVHVKLLFATGMMFVFVSDLIAYISTKYYSDRAALAFTCIFLILPLLLLCSYALLWKNGPFFMSYSLVFFACFGMPQACFSFISSLLSKITPSQHASSIQNFAVLNQSMALLVSKLILGMVFTQTWLIVYSVSLVVLWLIGIFWLGFEFHRLAPAN